MGSATFEQGWSAPSFKYQFPHIKDEDAVYLDSLNEAITTLYVAGLLTDSQKDEIRTKKMPREVAKVLKRNAKRVAPPQEAKQGEQA